MCMFILSMGHSVSLYHNFAFPGHFRGSTISGTWVVWYFCASLVWVKFRSNGLRWYRYACKYLQSFTLG